MLERVTFMELLVRASLSPLYGLRRPTTAPACSAPLSSVGAPDQRQAVHLPAAFPCGGSCRSHLRDARLWGRPAAVRRRDGPRQLDRGGVLPAGSPSCEPTRIP